METQKVYSKANALAVVLAMLMIVGGFLAVAPGAKAPLTNVVLTDSQYTGGTTYVPEETLEITLYATEGEVYDVVIAVTATDTILRQYDDVVIPAGDTAVLTYDIPSTLNDGQYQVEAGGQNYLSTRPVGVLRTRYFTVQEYSFNIEVDRRAYVGGDVVTVTWSANRLKDHALPPAGYLQLWAYNLSFPTPPTALISPSPYVDSDPTGTVTFTLPNLADPAADATVYGWFNSSATNPTRFQDDQTWFDIDSLSVIASVPGTTYVPGSVVTVSVTTVVTDNPSMPSTANREPNVDVDITVWDISGTTPVEVPEYEALDLVTDEHGELTHAFRLSNSIADDTDFEVRANATHQNGIWEWGDSDTFTVRSAPGLSLSLEFDRWQYEAGEAVTVTAIVSGSDGADLTYMYEVRDSTTGGCPSSGPLLVVATTDQDTFTYATDPNFRGDLCFMVLVDDGEGNRAVDYGEPSVVFGWLLVNADRSEYVEGNRITVTWSLRSSRMTSPDYFYEVRDSGGNLADSGTATSSFTFEVPDPASTSYQFTVIATEEGRAVSGSVTVSRVSGYALDITFDRSSYAPGDTVRIHYVMRSRSPSSPLPSTFRFSYGPIYMPSRAAQSSHASGDLTYVVPANMNQGDEIFTVQELGTGAIAMEVITIRGTNPLWFVTAGDIPVFDLLLFLLIIVLFLLVFRRGALGPRVEKPMIEEKPKDTGPVHAPPAAPMVVTCRNCNSPIEITTSKRPIEVMCPKCGNTEMVA